MRVGLAVTDARPVLFTRHLRMILMTGDLPECWIRPDMCWMPGPWPGCLSTGSMSGARSISGSLPHCSTRADQRAVSMAWPEERAAVEQALLSPAGGRRCRSRCAGSTGALPSWSGWADSWTCYRDVSPGAGRCTRHSGWRSSCTPPTASVGRAPVPPGPELLRWALYKAAKAARPGAGLLLLHRGP